MSENFQPNDGDQPPQDAEESAFDQAAPVNETFRQIVDEARIHPGAAGDAAKRIHTPKPRVWTAYLIATVVCVAIYSQIPKTPCSCETLQKVAKRQRECAEAATDRESQRQPSEKDRTPRAIPRRPSAP